MRSRQWVTNLRLQHARGHQSQNRLSKNNARAGRASPAPRPVARLAVELFRISPADGMAWEGGAAVLPWVGSGLRHRRSPACRWLARRAARRFFQLRNFRIGPGSGGSSPSGLAIIRRPCTGPRPVHPAHDPGPCAGSKERIREARRGWIDFVGRGSLFAGREGERPNGLAPSPPCGGDVGKADRGGVQNSMAPPSVTASRDISPARGESGACLSPSQARVRSTVVFQTPGMTKCRVRFGTIGASLVIFVIPET